MPHGQKNKQTIKQKKYCNKFNKDFKNVHIKNISFPPPQKKKKSVELRLAQRSSP